MVFRRRTPRSWGVTVREFFFPRGGWRRAGSYVWHRLRRLNDSPERIARGIVAGFFVSFFPIWGFHFLASALVAWILRGNILAALLGTFLGNPFTFPLMVASSLQVGSWLFDISPALTAAGAVRAFGRITNELGHNFAALFGMGEMRWDPLWSALTDVILPYFSGSFLSGAVCSVPLFFACVPLIRAYQARRQKKIEARFAEMRARDAARAAGDEPPAAR